jgi:hypothetical protein
MPQKFLVKRSSVEDKVPAAGDLDTGELALNLKDQKLYSKDADGNVFEIGEAPDLDGFVKLDDEGTAQSIVGGGGLEVAGGITSEFGTNAAQLGNVAPLNDWSCYPARGTVFYAPPAPIPNPEPEPVDPEFGVDEPTFSGRISGGIVSGGFVGTQDIIDLEGE